MWLGLINFLDAHPVGAHKIMCNMNIMFKLGGLL